MPKLAAIRDLYPLFILIGFVLSVASLALWLDYSEMVRRQEERKVLEQHQRFEEKYKLDYNGDSGT